jgi:hypothetical protein
MNLAHYSSHKRFDILKHVPFPYYPYAQHINIPSDEYLSCKLAPISFKRKCVREALPSIKQLDILNIDSNKTAHCPLSPQSLPSPVDSCFSSPSSPVSSSVSDQYPYQAPSNDHLNIPHKIDYGNKLRLRVSKRTCISEYQTTILNDFYRTNKYPTHNEKTKLSKQLNLTERTIQIWFQNKRQNRGRKCRLN